MYFIAECGVFLQYLDRHFLTCYIIACYAGAVKLNKYPIISVKMFDIESVYSL